MHFPILKKSDFGSTKKSKENNVLFLAVQNLFLPLGVSHSLTLYP